MKKQFRTKLVGWFIANKPSLSGPVPLERGSNRRRWLAGQRASRGIDILLAVTLLGLVVVFVWCVTLPATRAESATQLSQEPHQNETAPLGMVWIAGGEFTMGTDDVRSLPNERPAHRVQVEGFWIDDHDVTNAEFAKFVEATGYVTTAEQKPDWEELKKQLPPGTPKPDDNVLVPGSLVFTPTSRPVPLQRPFRLVALAVVQRLVPG